MNVDDKLFSYNKKNYPTFLVVPTAEQKKFFLLNHNQILEEVKNSKTEHLCNYPITKQEVLAKNKGHKR